MVAESFDLTRGNVGRLLSPIYPKSLSNDACIRLFYYIYGMAGGKLRVYIKPLSVHLDIVLGEPK